RQSIHPAARRAWLAAGFALHAGCPISRLTQSVLSLAHRHRVPHRRMAWHRAGGADADRLAPAAGIGRVRDRVGTALAAVSLFRERRADVLQLRLGDAAPRKRFPRDLPRRLGDRTKHVADLDVSMAAVPRHVRRRADQDPRRFVLARSDVSQLLLRDAADPESSQLVFSLASGSGAQRRRGPQSLRRAGRALRILRAPALCGHRGAADDRLSGCPDREWQPVLAELADGHALYSDTRRPVPVVASHNASSAPRTVTRSS